MFWKAWAEAGSPPRAVPQEAQGKGGKLVPMPKVSDGAGRPDARSLRRGRGQARAQTVGDRGGGEVLTH